MLLGLKYFNHKSIINFVITKAVYIEARIPIVRVTANPLIAPTPKLYNKKAAINVVTFESVIVANAESNPEPDEIIKIKIKKDDRFLFI